jgi:hypothetical protein
VSQDPHEQNRRSVYVFIRRNTAYPMLEVFDAANPNSVHSRRDVTTTAPQALALINSDLVYQWSEALAARVLQEAGNDESARLDRLYQILFSRSPDAFERQTLTAFLDSQEKLTQAQLAQGRKIAAPLGYDLTPQVSAQLDKLYESLYGRPADRFERVALVEYLDRQQEKLEKSQGGDEDAFEGDSASVQARAGARGGRKNQQLDPARAAAFVDLVHAVANSNEFIYRF